MTPDAPDRTPHQRERCEWVAMHLKREYNSAEMPVNVVRMKDAGPMILVVLPEADDG